MKCLGLNLIRNSFCVKCEMFFFVPLSSFLSVLSLNVAAAFGVVKNSDSLVIKWNCEFLALLHFNVIVVVSCSGSMWSSF